METSVKSKLPALTPEGIAPKTTLKDLFRSNDVFVVTFTSPIFPRKFHPLTSLA